jgi:hypothetical protein
MTNRREILQAAAVSALISGATGFVDIARASARTPFHFVLVDERHAAARSLRARLSGRGATALAIQDGDITQIWLNDIAPVWKHQPVPIAGLTERPALFCLEQFALACGLRVVFHGEHVLHPSGYTEHQLLRGADRAELSERDLARAGPRWPIRIADALAAWRAPAGGKRPGRSDAALEPLLAPGARLLTSWIIATA